MFQPENAQNEIQFLNQNDAKKYMWNSLNLLVPPTVYPPREDTTLLHSVLESIKPFGSHKLLEIGSGSGALSISAAKQGWNVHSCDVNPYAVAATRHNAQEANVEVDVIEGGLGPSEHVLHAWNPGTYDMVLWNMPYIPSEEIGDQLLGPLEEAALVDTHPEGLLSVFARTMATNKLCKMNGIALLVCREHIGWKRSIDILRQSGLAARIVKTQTFDDNESIHVIASWHPFVNSKHHQVREIDSTNAEMLRGSYSPGDSLVAAVQNNGRGRHGNDWQDHPQSFKGSWMLNPENLLTITPKKQLQIAHEISYALKLNEIHVDKILVKWPNDLLLRLDKQELWRKFGGILFQSFSKGEEQRVVLGVGINTKQDNIGPGQGAIEEIGIEHSSTELFTILNAVIASLFEIKHSVLQVSNENDFDSEYILSRCIYRNEPHRLESVSSHGLILMNEAEEKVSIDDDVELDWINLHPQ